MKRLLTSLLVILYFIAFTSPAYAQSTGISLQISPLPIELNVTPGHSATADLRVRNAGPQTEKLQTHLVKVTEDDNGKVHLSEPTSTDEFTKWVSFSRPVFDAPSNNWQTITMTVNVPSSAAFGYYFAVEFMRANQELPQAGKEVARGAVATFVLLNAVVKDAKREAEVVSFNTDHKFYEFLPVTFTAKLHSTGNVHVAPHGNIFILRGGKQVDVININEAQGNILPKSSRFFSADWGNAFPHYVTKTDAGGQPLLDKKGKPIKSLKWDLGQIQKIRFGHYTAHLVMIYDNGQRDVPIEASVKFWVVPWRLLLVLLVAGIFITIGLWTTTRSVWKKLSRKKSA